MSPNDATRDGVGIKVSAILLAVLFVASAGVAFISGNVGNNGSESSPVYVSTYGTMDPGGVPHYFGPYPNYANSPVPMGAVTTITVTAGGKGYTSPSVIITDYWGTGSGATASASIFNGRITNIAIDNGGANYSAPVVTIEDPTGTGAEATATIGGTLTGGIRKFVDSLPGLGEANANNLGNYITVAVPDKVTYPGCDYYEIAVVQYVQQLHQDLPPTLLRGYVQLETPVNAAVSKHIALVNPGGASILLPDGTQAYGVDYPHYLGTSVVAQRDTPVRVKFTNLLPTGVEGNLFLPVDSTVMGSGMGPLGMVHHIMVTDGGSGYTSTPTVVLTGGGGMGAAGSAHVIGGVVDHVHVTNGGMGYSTAPTVSFVGGEGSGATAEAEIMYENFTENRATLHLHGGFVPWISDGTPHQWTTPAGEATSYPKGVSVAYVPDMWFVNGTVVPNTIGQVDPPVPGATNNPGAGSLTFYYNNQQSARLMFYHDHSYGITRLNVYAGEAAAYLLTDTVEEALIDAGVLPSLGGLHRYGIPLVIQDKTFVDAVTMPYQDPTWAWGSQAPGTPSTGDLWMPHVYMPNQNPYDLSGMNAWGRWHYGPWFWPPTTDIAHGPVPNPYYDPINAPWEPPMIPGVPSNSMAMEAFMDTPTVNGAVYPYLEVDPQAYRFRILSVGNDRFFNLQFYVADPSVVTSDGRTNTEVKMVPAVATEGYPDLWPTDGRSEGVPDPATMGPSWIQIGTEGGFLPAPAVVENQPITWNLNPTTFNFGNVQDHSLLLGPAERADVIVDFSQFAGKTLILYNDAPAAFPARDPRYDYFTGSDDQTSGGGAPTVQPGFGPNIRTVMQIRVANITPAQTYNLTALNEIWSKTPEHRGIFESSQDPIIVPQAEYNSAYDMEFPEDPFVRIHDSEITFTTISGTTLTIPFEMKAIQDEMGEAYDLDYGRMSGMLGLEVPMTGGNRQNFMLYGYPSPPVDLVSVSLTAGEPIDGDGTQIWKITHNGVDTHTLHTHLYNMQVINRVAWDNAVSPPDANELGWKETLRVNPLEDTIVAIRPVSPTQPFEVPTSVRPIDPTVPVGTVLPGPPGGFQDPAANPVTVVNHLVNFGWEYVMHCHLLGHEEMDMMHGVVVAVPPFAPQGLGGTLFNTLVNLTWTDGSIAETGYIIQRANGTDPWQTIAQIPSPLESTGPTRGTLMYYNDTVVADGTAYSYRVIANTLVGDPTVYLDAIGFPTISVNSTPSNILIADTATGNVTIPPGPLAYINVTPPAASVVAGGQQLFSAIGLDANYTVIPGLTFNWSTNVGSIASDGLFTAQTAANVTGFVDATIGAITGSATVSIVSALLDHIIVSPSPVNVTAGGVQAFTAVAYDQFNNTVATTFTWASDVGTMIGSTLNAQTTAGVTGTVTATSGLVVGTAIVTIVPAALDHIVVLPASVSVALDSQTQFTATAMDVYNNAISGAVFLWTTNVGAVDSTGLFTAQSTPGTGYVNASIGAVTGSASVSVGAANSPPVLTPLTDTTATVGVPKAFSALATDIDGDPLRYTWSFGDGSALVVGQNVSHTFAILGVFTYTVYVDDLTGIPGHNVSSSAFVTVPFVMQLATGWNLVSIPVIGIAPFMASGIGLSFGDQVIPWNSATQTYGTPFLVGITPPLFDFQLQPGLGYWIYANGPRTLSLVGTVPTTQQTQALNVPATGGWVLVGLLSVNTTLDASDLGAMISGGPPSSIVGWNPATQSYVIYVVGVPMVAFALVPGQAYWIFMYGPGTLTYNP